MAKATKTDWGVSEDAARVHREAIVWDNTLPITAGNIALNREKYLPRLKASGYDVVSLTVGGDRDKMPGTITRIAKESAYFLARPDDYVLVKTVQDIERAKREDKLAVIFHFQGTNPVDSDINMVATYYELGIRHMLMAYNLRNAVGDGCKERTDDGLSRFGVRLVEEMNRVGMVVDCTHTGHKTSMEAMEFSTAPVVFSHANPKALKEHPRNIADDQIKACAKTGGVIGVNGVGIFLGDNDGSTETQIRHVDYLVQMVGADHVGFALDWVIYSATTTPSAWNPPAPGDVPWPDIKHVEPEQMPAFTEGLLKMGYKEADVGNILGGNWLRIAREVWK
jgi:membrane dipeptidase